MEDIKNKIEAVLYTVGKFLTVEEIAKASNIGSTGLIKKTLNKLKEEYQNKDTALILEEKDNRFKLSIKKQYLGLTKKLLTETEFDRPTQETLAIIAYKNPILQANVVKIRGNTAYDHVKSLVEQGLISAEKSGRTKLLKLTPHFYDYFDIAESELSSKLNEIKVDEKTEKELQEVKQRVEETKKQSKNV